VRFLLHFLHSRQLTAVKNKYSCCCSEFLLIIYYTFHPVKVMLRIFRSTSGRLLRVNLIQLVSNVRPPVHTSVHPSIHSYVCPSVCLSAKCFFNFNEIWCVGRGRQVMHDSMQYDPIQGQGQGHEP